MAQPTIKDLFGSLQTEMIAKARLSETISHPVDKGDNSEKNWLAWFQDYLPHRYMAAKATVIDSKGNQSDQIDIVLYDRQYSYLALNQNDILYVPAESVYAVFEVKQELSKQNMEYAGKKAESVRKLYRSSAPIYHAGGVFPPVEPKHILAGILTTRSGWTPPFGEPFKKCLKNYDQSQQIDCGCVLQAGSFHYDYGNAALRTGASDESLVSFFLQLLTLLQQVGTVPAIDLAEYMKALSVSEVHNG